MESPEKKKKRNRAKGRGKRTPGDAPEPGERPPSPGPSAGPSMQPMEKSKETSTQEQLSKDLEKKLQFEDSGSVKKQGKQPQGSAQQSAPGQGKRNKGKQQKEGGETKAEQMKIPERPKLGASGPPGTPARLQVNPQQPAPQQAWGKQATPQQGPPPQQVSPQHFALQQIWHQQAAQQAPRQPVNLQQFAPQYFPPQQFPSQQMLHQQATQQQVNPQQFAPQAPLQQVNPQHFHPQQFPPQQLPPQQMLPQQPTQQQAPFQQFLPQQFHPQQIIPQQFPTHQTWPQQHIPTQQGPPLQIKPQELRPQQINPQHALPSQANTIPQQPILPQAPQRSSGPPSDVSDQQKPKAQQAREQKGQKKQTQSSREAAKETAPSRSTSVSTISSEKSAVIKHPPTKTIMFSDYKGPGTAGTKVKFETNYVRLILSKLTDVAYHYDVAIDPDRPKKLMKDVFEAFRQKNFPQFTMAYDRAKNAYTIQRLNLPPGGFNDEVTIDDREMSRSKTFKVSIQETEDHEVKMNLLKSQTAFMNEPDRGKVLRAHQCLEIILRMAAQGGLNVGRQYYWPPQRPILLDDVMELWQGIYHSAIFGRGPLLNVDITNKGFPKGMSVLEVFKIHCRSMDRVDNRDLSNIKSHLNGLNISYAPKGNEASRRVYKFHDFKDTARNQKFTHNGALMTIEEYFGKILNIRLQFPNLPVLHVGPRDKNIYLPAELCTIPAGQAVMKKLTDMQTRSMIRETATSTDVRKERILNILRKANFNASPIVSNFGISVGQDFIDVDARILNAPKLEYSNRKTVLPRDGVWRNEQFIVPTTIQKWAILVLDYRANILNITNFAEQLAVAGRKVNMSISKPPAPIQIDIGRNRKNFQEEMRRWKGNVDILLVVIPSFGNAYQEIKTAAEVEYGILTQCVKCQTIDKVVQRNDQATLTNILLKMNSKLNGLNHRILSQGKMKLGVLKDGNFIVVGADVTHPSPDQRDIPSIVGVAASYDEDGFRYKSMWRIQEPKKEMINDLATIIEEHLQFYKKERKTLPHTIIYYRDGVGEGDFQNVLNIEFNAIKQGASRLDAKYKPNICFIVVQKRHHTRLFPEKKGPSVGKNKNVPPGTIVDTTIVPAIQNQFYLVAHQAIQGVAKPTKYCILVDEANIPIDELQALTYNLCHMFTRCNRAVSYVAPTYYAHLMAARGKVYVEGQRLNMKDLPKEYEKRKIKDDVAMRHPMFFV
uniref:Putative germ-line stem cell division protein hiwi/piwi n=1 Tax=Nyssomyia neivai TaxID=330878 RepID=A0A1L8DX88_9DIPT